jgi:outer membrane protein OmpA-like peptidoglycan-associated protein
MKKILLIIFIAALGLTSRAQNSENQWLLGIGFNYVDFNAIEMSLGEQFTNANWMGKSVPSMLRLGRYLNKSFNASGIVSMVKLDPAKLNEIPLNKEITYDQFWKYGVQLEYKFANDYLLKETSWFDPYVYLGLNGTSINETTYLSNSMGVGINFWVIPQLGANIQGSYDYIWDFNDYLHYSFGVVLRFGAKKDKDGDGIIDKRDACPDVYGLELFDGCPDTDGDGIPDNLDSCVNVPGLAEFHGCPDTDGDGIMDMDDACPTVAGLAEFNGCPDTDGDGIIDQDDACPEVAGIPQFNGCPDTDGDGIPDPEDKCPNEVGPASNNGCPVPKIVPVEINKAISFNAQDIEFHLNSAKINPTSYDKLDNIVKIMKDHPDARFTIYGYTDNTGTPEYNLQLSEKRAQSVRDYFVKKGIDPKRLEAKGFGIQSPIAPNNTTEGRAKNRRVEINLIKNQ